MPIKQGNQEESALHQLVGRIERALDAKEYTHCVFFDIEGAFDNTTMDSIRTALDDWKVYRSVRNWIIALIKERSVWRSPCALRKLPMTPPPVPVLSCRRLLELRMSKGSLFKVEAYECLKARDAMTVRVLFVLSSPRLDEWRVCTGS